MNQFKILLVIALISITACDEIPDGVVEQTTSNYQVKSITAPVNVTYNSSDSSFTVSIQIENSKNINSTWLSVASIDRSIEIIERQDMVDDGILQISGDKTAGDNVFTTKILMSKKFPSGEYIINFYVDDISKNKSKAGSQTFMYVNSQTPTAPVISNLIIPEKVDRGVSFNFSIQVFDQNGLNDIAVVFFKLYRPDGTLVLDTQNNREYFTMVDNGDTILGDQVAGDGIFSFKNSFGTTSQTGKWRFEFQARDRDGLYSNKIIYELTVN